MATWISNYLASLGLGPEFEPYFTGVLYDQNLSEEEKSATVYECLEVNCEIVSCTWSPGCPDISHYPKNRPSPTFSES
jgi:hypothetical protein